MVGFDPIASMARELHPLGVAAEIISTAANITRKEWGGSQAYIRAIDRPARDEAIRAALNQGMTPEAVARKTGASVATVRRRRSMWF